MYVRRMDRKVGLTIGLQNNRHLTLTGLHYPVVFFEDSSGGVKFQHDG